MKPRPRDLMVARAVREAMWGEMSDYSLTVLIQSLSEPAEVKGSDKFGGNSEPGTQVEIPALREAARRAASDIYVPDCFRRSAVHEQAAQDAECLRRRVEELERQIERDAHAHHQSCFDGCETLVSEDRSAVDAIRAEQRSWVKLDLLWEHRELLLALADVAFERCRMPAERRESNLAAARDEGAREERERIRHLVVAAQREASIPVGMELEHLLLDINAGIRAAQDEHGGKGE